MVGWGSLLVQNRKLGGRKRAHTYKAGPDSASEPPERPGGGGGKGDRKGKAVILGWGGYR